MELPLFPMNTVLCPGIALPVHIFEDRYRALVRHCIDTTSPFGVVMIREGREVGTGAISFTGIGTIAEIRDAGRYEDGRYDLLIVGTRRFEIQRVLGAKQPYLVAEVELLEEPLGDEEAGETRRRRVTIPDDPTVLSYLLSGILQVESPRRQALLEIPTSEARLRALLRIIDREILLLERRLRLFRPDARLLGSRRS